MWTGYGYFNKTEIWSNERTLAYLAGDPLNGIAGLRTPSTSFVANCGCDTARPLYCDQGAGEDGAYTSVAMDPAPWYDPYVPDSEEFAGLFVEDIVGFDSTVNRTVNEGAINGGSLGPLKLGTRSITVTGWLRARTCCGAEYGLRWLSEALLGNAACEDCKLGDLYMIKCCPEVEDTICHLQEISETQLVSSRFPIVTVTDNGGGSYTLLVDDPDQTLVVSDSLGALNNTDGFLPTCLDGVDPLAIADYTVTPENEDLSFNFQLPYPNLSGIATNPSGDGASWTGDIDTTIASACPDTQSVIDETAAVLADWVVRYGSGTPVTVENVSQGRCLTEAEGPDPLDYARLFHRTGLVDGPKVLERRGTCCSSNCGCVNIKVQFTLTSELPYIFSDIDWCLQQALFPRDEVFCNPLDWCVDCGDTIGTQTVTREIARPECRVTVRYDGTWCADGWDPDTLGFPPPDCLMVPDPETYDPTAEGNTAAGATGDPCLINLVNGGTWDPVNFDPTDAFPPSYCDLKIADPNGDPFICEEQQIITCESGGGQGNLTCSVTLNNVGGAPKTWTSGDFDPAVNGFPPDGCTVEISNGTPGCSDPDDECPVRLTYDYATGDQTWEPILTDSGCECYVVSEYCLINAETCLVKVIYDVENNTRTWEPIRWDGNLADNDCTCFLIAEIQVKNSPDDACPPTSTVDCPIILEANGNYTKVGWSWDEDDGIFPPADCNITIANPQETGPLTEEIEIPGDLFVPDCGPFPIVPPEPFSGFESCYCEPWATFRACCTYENPYQWNDATSFIEIRAGSREIRNLKIEAYKNPWAGQGVACPCDPNDEFWLCREPCSTLLVPQLPSGSIISIDSRTRVAEVTFAGGKATNGLRYIESADGRPFEWFDISHCSTFCIVVSADCTTIAEDAQVSVGFMSRYLASGW